MATTMLNVYDLNRKKTAVLQNAFSITETKELNQIYRLDFSIPVTDEKTQYIQAFHYVRYGEDGELYRIVSVKKQDSDTSILAVSCEHVIATLVDDVIFGDFKCGGGEITTDDVIIELLKKQKTKNWTLGGCAFTRKFEYLWEQETVLNALYSIPKEFVNPYMWSFDTTVYPWKLYLKAIDETINPEYYIRAKSNLLSSNTEQDFTGICTRIYPLGYGEGVNQLTIKDVNPKKDSNNVGLPYLEAPENIIKQYGIKEKVLVDRRYENAESLMAYGQTMLDALSVPSRSRSFDVVDLYPITGDDIDNAQPGQIAKLTEDGTVAYITKTVRVLDDPGNLQIELSTKATDVASAIADLADRVRIESVYAQGATQLYQHSKDANATSTKGMIMSLYFPEEMKQINKVLMRLKIGKFRSYSKATDSKTVTVKTCENKTVTIKTNPTALDNIKTTKAGGGTTSESGADTITVGGGYTSNNSTNEMKEGLSLGVEASGAASAPMETQTSEPSTDLTSGTVWGKNDKTSTSTEFAINGSIDLSVITDHKFYGGTYALSSSTDGYHTHYNGNIYIDPDGNNSLIDGGIHDHKVSVDVPQITLDVKNNIYSGDTQKYHQHNITYNSLSHNHKIPHYHKVTVHGSASGGKHTHSFSIPNHSHTIPEHSHNLPSLSHNHSIVMNGHSHTITLNPHSHDIEAGIFESGNPNNFSIYVNGAADPVITVNATSFEDDITEWLLDAQKQVPRNQWIDIEIRPNDLAYVQASVFVQGFVQSRGGGNY